MPYSHQKDLTHDPLHGLAPRDGATPGEAAVIRRITGGVGELLMTAGVFVLLFIPWQLWWTTVVAERESRAVTASLSERWQDPTQAPTTSAEPTASASAAPDPQPVQPPVVQPPPEGQPFGIMHIPAFGPDYAPRPLVQGVSVADLKAGVGHYPGTVMPGAVGNFSVAGHRTTYGAPFNRIAELAADDAIVVETKTGWYSYVVRETKIVAPTQVDVIAAVPGAPGQSPTEAVMTLTSCHPMYSAQQRYIVHAEFDTFAPRSAGAPEALARAQP